MILIYPSDSLAILLNLLLIMSRAALTEETREEILNNPLNDSTSKIQWSFPR